LPARVKFFPNPIQTAHCAQCAGPVRPKDADQLCSRCQASRKKRW
jgi:Zn finger protein HypA/HybF involved in hydrogenase expression